MMAALSVGAIVGIAVGAVIGVCLIALILRTLLTRPKDEPVSILPPRPFDQDKVTAHIQEAVRYPTVTMVDDYKGKDEPFLGYRAFLEREYPLLHAHAERTVIGGYSLVFHLKGRDPSLKPACFLSHQDVVPAPDVGWDYPPFGGELHDGFVYGRGALDMKNHMIALLEGVEQLLKEGKEFERDVYLCFGHDEESSASLDGAPNIVKYFERKGVRMEFVVDEGGSVIDGNQLGIPHPLAMIGASEKGNGDLEITVRKAGGHGATPQYPTADGVLADVIRKVERHPMRPRFTPLAKTAFATLAPHAKGIFKFFFVNRDVFSPLLLKVLGLVAPMTNALIRTTLVPTVLTGAPARNIIPAQAKVNINFRILTGQTGKDVEAHLNKILRKEIRKGWVSIDFMPYWDPCEESTVDCSAFETIKRATRATFPDVVVAPYPIVAATDSRFYRAISDCVYRFSPFMMSMDDQPRVHGYNERVRPEAMVQAANWFANVIQATCCQ